MSNLLSRLFQLRPEKKEEVADMQNKEPTASGPAPVTIYTTTWCASCRMAKGYLQQKGVEYEEIDIDRVPEAAELVMSLARGYKTVPTMIIGESVVVDWDRKALDAALSEAGWFRRLGNGPLRKP